MYATTTIHGTAYTVLHIAIEMQIAFFFASLDFFFLIVVNQPRLLDVNEGRKGKERKALFD
jgi:hypothetical protein